MEPSGTAPESSPLITCAFIVISGKPATDIWARGVKVAITKHILGLSDVSPGPKNAAFHGHVLFSFGDLVFFAGTGTLNFQHRAKSG